MKSPLVVYEGVPHVVLRETEDWGIRVLDLASPPRRLRGGQNIVTASIRTHIDPYNTRPYPTPAELLGRPLVENDTWRAMSKRSLARFEAFFLAAEDPQRRLDAREVVTLAHQVSLVRHILDSTSRRRVLIGDEVGLGKTVEAGLIIHELLEADPGLRVLYLAPARLVSNVGREFKRLSLFFREWKSQDGDARLETDSRIIASIHRAVHPNHFDRLLSLPPWDLIIVDECHHLSDWGEGGGDPVMKYRLVRQLVAKQPAEGTLLLLSGTPHQAHAARFENLLRLLQAPEESQESVAGRVIYRTKEDVRDWDGNPLFPQRQVNAPIVVDLDPAHRQWLSAIHAFFKPPPFSRTQAVQRAAGWKCAQALQWATSSPNAGLGYLVRQAMRAGWTLDDAPLPMAIASLRPYRSGPKDEPIESVYRRLSAEIRRQTDDDDIEDIEEQLSRSQDIDHQALAELVQQGIELVASPRQPKWEALNREVLNPANGEKVVLFAQPIETVMALVEWLEATSGQRPAIIIGGQSDEERDREVARFRDIDGPQFLVSSRAGGEGINLQVARRLVHLDVPWNPMELEQRVGRVHRFGSRDTIIVDTLVVRDSRETHAWSVARDRLLNVARTLVAPDRFETVFSRVMCLIPTDELQNVLISQPAGPLRHDEVQQLTSLVDSGFREWRSFHDRFAENQRRIRDQPAGLARWRHVRDFLVRHGHAESVTGVAKTRFIFSDGKVNTVDEKAEVIRFKDGSLYFVGDFESALFNSRPSDAIKPLGLNINPVADVLRAATSQSLPTGAAHLRWGDAQKEIRASLGDEVIVLGFARQTFQLDSIGGVKELGTDLLAYVVKDGSATELSAEGRDSLFDLGEMATLRMKPAVSGCLEGAIEEEQRLLENLRRPPDELLRQGIRYAVWPILAVHVAP